MYAHANPNRFLDPTGNYACDAQGTCFDEEAQMSHPDQEYVGDEGVSIAPDEAGEYVLNKHNPKRLQPYGSSSRNPNEVAITTEQRSARDEYHRALLRAQEQKKNYQDLYVRMPDGSHKLAIVDINTPEGRAIYDRNILSHQNRVYQYEKNHPSDYAQRETDRKQLYNTLLNMLVEAPQTAAVVVAGTAEGMANAFGADTNMSFTREMSEFYQGAIDDYSEDKPLGVSQDVWDASGTNMNVLVAGASMAAPIGGAAALKGTRLGTKLRIPGYTTGNVRRVPEGAGGTNAWTSESALNSVTGRTAQSRQKAIDAILKEDLANVKMTYQPRYSPYARTGVASPPGNPDGAGIQIGKKAFSSRKDLVDTIIHEELHHRWWNRGIPSFHHSPDKYVPNEKFYRVIDRFKRMKGL